MIRLLQILPRVPPAICGIGDYSWRLAKAMRDGHDIHSCFLSAGTSWLQPPLETEFPVSRLPSLSSAALQAWLQGHVGEFDALLLHVSPYGYQKRAVPFWLASAWRKLPSVGVRVPRIAMFHELYASGSVMSSSFWLQPLQKKVLRQIATHSEALRTNREHYAAWLESVPGVARGSVTTMPVFSNFGELDAPPPLLDREAAMVNFSSGMHGGTDAWQTLQKMVKLCHRFNLHTLHVVGGAVPPALEMDGVKIIHRKFLPEAEATPLLANCRVAFTGYHPQYLAKSGILASYAAHGIAGIAEASQSPLPDGLADGRELLFTSSLASSGTVDLPTMQGLADRLHSWYTAHSLAENAKSYASQIRNLLTPP